MRGLWCALAWGFSTVLASGFVGVINSAGELRHWALNPTDSRVQTSSVNRGTRAIIYRLDGAAYSTTNTAAELNSVRAAFDQWQGVSGTTLKFEEGGMLSNVEDINSLDHTNSLFWTRNLFVNGGRDNLSGIVALTYVASFRSGNVIFDADTVFNGAEFAWFTDYQDPTRSKVFVEGIALHEIGHFLGLEHSPVGGGTMLAGGERGVNLQAGLAADELTAVRGLYGTSQTLGSLGRVSGRVTLSGTPILGAAVFAENLAGETAAGTVTWTNGLYEMPALPPGPYKIRAAPLDPAFASTFLVRGRDISASYEFAETAFLTSADRTIDVRAGTLPDIDFDVSPGVPLRVVRLLRPTPDLSSASYSDVPVSIQPANQTLFLGVLIPGVPAGDVRLQVTGNGLDAGAVVIRPDAIPGYTLVAQPVTLLSAATPGLRNIRVETGGQVGWAHAFLEILPPFPDFNVDGLDDRFQRQYWTRFTVPEAAPAADPDQDGFANDWEFRTGSIPTNRLSAHFEIESVRVMATGARVRSQTAKGKRFQLYAREAVPGADWQAVGRPVTAAAETTEFLDPVARAVRFYRLQLLP